MLFLALSQRKKNPRPLQRPPRRQLRQHLLQSKSLLLQQPLRQLQRLPLPLRQPLPSQKAMHPQSQLLPLPLQVQPQAFRALVTIHSPRLRAWAFLALLLARATTHLLLRRAWVAQAQVVRLVPVVRVAQVALVALVVRLVPVAQVVLVDLVVLVVLQVQVSVLLVRVPVALRVLVVLAHLVRVALLAVALVVAVAVLAVEPLVRSVRAVLAGHRRHVSQSARNAKSTSRDKLQALVAQLCRAATATPFCACVAVRASKILPTRLMPMPVS